MDALWKEFTIIGLGKEEKPWVVVSFSEGRNKDPHPIIVSSHDTEEEAMSALAYTYLSALAGQPAVSMINYTTNAETCFWTSDIFRGI